MNLQKKGLINYFKMREESISFSREVDRINIKSAFYLLKAEKVSFKNVLNNCAFI